MWEAVERAPGEYNMTYLDEIEALINKLGSYGIYTMVDNHNDVFARRMCGEGVPDFYAKNEDLVHTCDGTYIPYFANQYGECKSMSEWGHRIDENGNPVISDCQRNNFVKYFSSAEASSAFDNFYSNKNGIQDKFIDY